MYRIPLDLKLDGIVGSEIHQICVGRYDVQFRFNSGRHICVQSVAEVLDNEVVVSNWNEDEGWSTTTFFLLLNRAVTGYTVANDQMLEITFEDGIALRLHDTSDQYESMQIGPEGYVI